MQQKPDRSRLRDLRKGPVALEKRNKRADATVIALLMREALTLKQICERLNRSQYTVHVLVTVWHDLGLVYVESYAPHPEGGRGRRPARWKWQPEPFHYEDARCETQREANKRVRAEQEARALWLIRAGYEVEDAMKQAGLNAADRACKGRLNAAHAAAGVEIKARVQDAARFALAS